MLPGMARSSMCRVPLKSMSTPRILWAILDRLVVVDFLKEAERKNTTQNTNTNATAEGTQRSQEQKEDPLPLSPRHDLIVLFFHLFLTLKSHKGAELELLELLLSSSLPVDPDHVEAHGLGKGPALTNGDNITLLHTEARRQMGREVPVPLLVPVELLDVVHVIPAHDTGAPHLGGGNNSGQNTATDRDVSCERALLVNVGSLDGLAGSLEAEADVAVVATTLLLGLGGGGALGVHENGILLLESLLVLQKLKKRQKTIFQSTFSNSSDFRGVRHRCEDDKGRGQFINNSVIANKLE